jgi:hypothetical protein
MLFYIPKLHINESMPKDRKKRKTKKLKQNTTTTITIKRK